MITIKEGSLWFDPDDGIIKEWDGTTWVPVPTVIEVMTQLYNALQAAEDHLSYCGYGDKWERECAEQRGLEKQISAALVAAKKVLEMK